MSNNYKEYIDFYKVDEKAYPYSLVIKLDSTSVLDIRKKLLDICSELKDTNIAIQCTTFSGDTCTQIIRPRWIDTP